MLAFFFTKDLTEGARTRNVTRFGFPLLNRRSRNSELMRDLIAAEAARR